MYKILLVDDEILVREAIRDKIAWRELGFSLVGDCENGKEAVEFLKKEPVDLVLTDICMPYMDGLELSKYLYENYPETAIVIFSGYSDFEYAKKAIQYKVSEYILKPITKSELSEVLVKAKEQLDEKKEEEQKLNKLHKIYHNYTKNEAAIIAKILEKLIKGTQGVEASLTELEEIGIVIRGKSFRVAAVDIDVYSDAYAISEELKKESALMAFVVENISEEVMEIEGAGVAFQDTNNRTYLLFSTNLKEELDLKSKKVCEEIQEKVKENTGLSISIGIGIKVQQIADLPKSYETAMNALKLRFSQGEGMIYDMEKIKAKADVSQIEDLIGSFKLFLAKNEIKNAKKAIVQIESWLKEKQLMKSEIIVYLHQIIQIIYKHAKEIDKDLVLSEEETIKITKVNSLNKGIEMVKAYLDKTLEHASKINKSSTERQTELALEYIEKNFDNPDLTLNDICNYLGVSTSYFSSFFKEATGKTFTEELTHIRLERAKKLLVETSFKNYEIAQKVGYSDPHYFNIAFKKAIGMTPKKFAKERK